ncbi:transglutaminase family protein [Roseixanthobacter liquoris]|uniref:transglutaminase family protein n=1 Tax=Roseixanthobacter liquoris TaxID=3119921 RepID=UPI003727C0CA
MRVRIYHQIIHKLEPGLRIATATIKLTPRNHEGQHIVRWPLDVHPDCRLYSHEDAFGNLCHTFSVEGPLEQITLLAEGDVETRDMTGVVRGTVERFPPSLFLRQTDFTVPDAKIEALAAQAADADGPLAQAHALMALVHDAIEEIPVESAALARAAAAVLAGGEGTSGEIAHVFTAAARHLRIPARHISGYATQDDEPGTAREWAEVHVPKLGWVAFDCGRKVCATEEHVRVAVALDSLGVAPVRGTGINASTEATANAVTYAARHGQSQSQTQE